jgi:hypothetical protein
MEIAVRFRIYPAQFQRRILRRWMGAQRFIYNLTGRRAATARYGVDQSVVSDVIHNRIWKR